MKKICLVGMSGGVDSSVTAALMRNSGYEVVGCTLRMFDSERAEQSIADAAKVAKFLKISHKIVDCRKSFKKKVEDYFVNCYFHAQTPNPCVMCNRFVKFETLNAIREELYADTIATGHYAKLDHHDNEIILRQAIDLNRDQSYFLYAVDPKILKMTILPLGEFPKNHVRELARQFGIHVAEKHDSQDVCFIENNDYTSFIKNSNGAAAVSLCGNIVDENGMILGQHRGIVNYTIGQRKGLGLAGGPFFVKFINREKNEIVVSNKNGVGANVIFLDEVKFIGNDFLGKCEVKIRSTNKKIKAELLRGEKYFVKLTEMEYGIAEGQHCVFYRDDIVLGGGIIVRNPQTIVKSLSNA